MTGKVGKQKERKRKEGGKGCADAIVGQSSRENGREEH